MDKPGCVDTLTLAQALLLPRVAICGPSRTGKTTLANTVQDGRDVVHTDDFIGVVPPESIGEILADSLEYAERFCLEGVKAANALRAGLEVDVAIWLDVPHVLHTDGQARQAKGIQTVFNQWLEQDRGKTPVVVPSAEPA